MEDDTGDDASSSIIVGEEIGLLVGRGIGPRHKIGLFPLCFYNREAWTLYLISPADIGGVGYYCEP